MLTAFFIFQTLPSAFLSHTYFLQGNSGALPGRIVK